MEAYNHCHDPNGIYGVVDRNDNLSGDGMLYEHERRYEFALRVNSIRGSVAGTSRVLNAMGCHNLLQSYLDTAYSVNTNYIDTVHNEQMELYHEACWRVSQWDTLDAVLDGNYDKHRDGDKQHFDNLELQIHSKHGRQSMGFHGSIYNALCALKSQNADTFGDALFQAKLNLIREPFTERESIQPLYGIMVKWAMLQSIETAWNALIDPQYRDPLGTNPLFDLSSTYRGRHFFETLHPQNMVLHSGDLNHFNKNMSQRVDDVLFSSFDFDLLEPLWSLHSTLFSILPNRLKHKTIQISPPKDDPQRGKIDKFKKQCPPILSHFYCFAQIARNANRLSVAHRILQCAQELIFRNKQSDPSNVDLRFDEGLLMEYALKLEEGRYLWAEGHRSRALQKALSVMNEMPSSSHRKAEKSYENQQLRAESHCDIGEWLMASHLRDPEMTKDILVKGENININLNRVGTRKLGEYRSMFNTSYCRSSYLLAKFSDGIYQNLENRFHSEEWRQFENRLRLQEQQIQSLSAMIRDTQNEISKLSKRRRRNAELDEKLRAAKQRLTDQSVLKRRIQKDHEFDGDRKEKVKKQRQEALTTSVAQYCSALVFDSKYDLYILYRLISLWFDNAESNYTPTKIIAKYFDGSHSSQIPTAKLIPLVYQIASRLSIPTKTEQNVDQFNDGSNGEENTNNTSWSNVEDQKKWTECQMHGERERGRQIATNFFHSVIYNLIRVMSSQHPHHCLYQIYQLCNVDKANESARIKTGYRINESKKLAASKLIDQLKGESHLQPIVMGIGSLIDAYCSISGASSREAKQRRHGQKVTFPISNYPKMLNIVNMHQLPIATVDLSVISNGNGMANCDIPYLSRYKGEAALAASGITCPVIVDVLGSDGNEYRELIKPQDDLRQDAVMEQVFVLVNKVLLDHNKSNEHILRKRIRTYKVVPLTPTIGIVQWVKGTMPIGMYLNRAHEKYKRNGDYLPTAARKKFAETVKIAQQRQKSMRGTSPVSFDYKAKLRKQFDDICDHFPPVFHKFFIERFCNSSCSSKEWFTARLSYIISCAINCIIGYLLGLGDRHTQNILIDLESAELIHIDLGVAFDQGKLLKTPECVPFRLTRDIVDGFGLNSVEGTFRKICVEVLKLMRENQQIFYTVLRVFVHDPLYKWSLDPEKMNRLQLERDEEEQRQRQRNEECLMAMNQDEREKRPESASNNNNEQAQRALHILRQKFQGNDNTQMNVISVEGQVNRLIRDARDRNNLCQMFHGWCSWM